MNWVMPTHPGKSIYFTESTSSNANLIQKHPPPTHPEIKFNVNTRGLVQLIHKTDQHTSTPCHLSTCTHLLKPYLIPKDSTKVLILPHNCPAYNQKRTNPFLRRGGEVPPLPRADVLQLKH